MLQVVRRDSHRSCILSPAAQPKLAPMIMVVTVHALFRVVKEIRKREDRGAVQIGDQLIFGEWNRAEVWIVVMVVDREWLRIRRTVGQGFQW